MATFAVALTVEFVDEIADGTKGAALPLIRADLGLSYAQIGLLISVPLLAGSVIELPLGLVAGQGRARHRLVLLGGVIVAGSLGAVAVAHSVTVLLIAFVAFFPASGAFVSLTQAALMDASPGRHQQRMAAWNLAGSAGAVAGPLLLAGVLAVGGDWRAAYLLLAAAAGAALAAAFFAAPSRPSAARGHGAFSDAVGVPQSSEDPDWGDADGGERGTGDADGGEAGTDAADGVEAGAGAADGGEPGTGAAGNERSNGAGSAGTDGAGRARAGDPVGGDAVSGDAVGGDAVGDPVGGEHGGRASVRDALRALRSGNVARWVVLLEVSDLLLDVLTGYIGIYLVDVAGASPAEAALGVAVRLGGGLAGDALFVVVSRRVTGRAALKVSAVTAVILYPAFLVVPWLPVKLAILAALSLATACWYPVIQAGLYTALPGRSGIAVFLSSAAGLLGAAGPLAVGVIAQQARLTWALAALAATPAVVLAILPSGARPAFRKVKR